MAEYIIKETLQAKLNRKKAGPANRRYTEGWNDAILMVKSMIHSEKATDVAPVRHGRWLPQVVLGQKAWDCSECKTLGSPHWKWCPVCGCKMDLEGDNHA